METRYDAIVIGAGLGGLSVAAFLAQKGRSVLLLERHNVPGGYATSFVRGRYEFEVALHELSGLGPPERGSALYRYLDSIGVAQRVEFLQIPELYRSILPGVDVTMPAGRKEFEAALCEAFPNEASGIQRFLGRIFDLNREIAQITRERKLGNPLTALSRYRNTVRYLPAVWGTVLNRDVKDPDARAVLSQLWGYFGLPPNRSSYLLYAIALATYVKLGPTFVRGRSQALSAAFVDAIEQGGGRVRFNCGVAGIDTQNGRVTGVVTEDGERYEADFIASNADPIVTCRDMIGQDNVPSSFFQRLQSSRVGASTVNVYMGIARSPEDLGMPNHETFINADNQFDRHYEAMHSTERVESVVLTCYNKVFPEISEPGTTVGVITALVYGEPWSKVPPEKYVDVKTRFADRMLAMAEQVAPDIRQYLEVVEVATPLTNMRYAGTLDGSIYGFDNTPQDHTILRMGHRGPVKGLYFVGAWTQPGGGFEPAMMSGQLAGSMMHYAMKKSGKGA